MTIRAPHCFYRAARLITLLTVVCLVPVFIGLKSKKGRFGEATISITWLSDSAFFLESMGIRMIDLLIRVIVADNHPVSIKGVKNILRTAPSIRVVAVCRNATQLVDTLGTGSVQLHKLAALQVSSILTKSDPIEHVAPAIYSSMLCSGGNYWSPRVADTIQYADTYSRRLTPRESEVVRLFMSGLPVKDIAAHLGRSIKTVSSQKCSAMKKMGAASDSELIRAVLDGVGDDPSHIL